MRSIILALMLCFMSQLASAFAVVEDVKPSAADKLERARRSAQVNRETAANWQSYCAHCHGMDGRPQSLVELPMPDAPDFSHADWADYEVDDLIDSIADGTGKMPAFSEILTKAEIRNLSALVTRLPRGRAGTLIAKRWQFRQRDNELREELSELRLSKE